MTEDELNSKLYPYAFIKQEYIVCAAMHYLEDRVFEHQPKNITSGIVMCGLRHCNAISNMHQLTGMMVKAIEGFLTSKNRFVNRQEAAKIAFEAGQTPKLVESLFSEDLY